MSKLLVGLLTSLLKPVLLWLAGRKSGIDAQRARNAEDTVESIERAKSAKEYVMRNPDLADRLRDEFTRK